MAAGGFTHNDRAEAVCDCKNCALRENLANHDLDLCVRTHIYRRCALVHDQDLCIPEYCSGETQQLTLTDRQCITSISNIAV